MTPDERAADKARQKEEQRRFEQQRAARDLIENLGDKIATVEPPKPREIIPGILPCASTIVAGAGHEGKTVTLLFLLIRVALGLSVFGRECREGPVLFVFGEDSTNDVRRLVHLITRQSYPEQNMSKRINDRLNLLNASKVRGGLKLLREIDGAWHPAEWFHTIGCIIEGQGYSAVALDTLSSLGLPESSGMNDAAAAYHLAANGIAELHDLAFIGSHHVGQNAAQNRAIGMYSARGATAITDNARCVIQVQRHQGSDEYVCPFDMTDKYVTRLHVVKHKWSTLRPDTPLWIEGDSYRCKDHAELTGGRLADAKYKAAAGHRIAKREALFGRIEDAVYDLRKQGIPATKDNIADFVDGVGVNKVRTGIDQMLAKGDLVGEKLSNGKPGPDATVYQIKRFKKGEPR